MIHVDYAIVIGNVWAKPCGVESVSVLHTDTMSLVHMAHGDREVNVKVYPNDWVTIETIGANDGGELRVYGYHRIDEPVFAAVEWLLDLPPCGAKAIWKYPSAEATL